MLAIVFWNEKEMSADVVVRPDGKISLPLLNEIQASGLTPEQLRESITAAADEFVQDPRVAVVVKAINSRKVFITGQVFKPGPYPLGGPTTVLQLIAMAGGLQEYADKEKIGVLRTENGQPSTISLQLQRRHRRQEHTAEHRVEAGRYGCRSVRVRAFMKPLCLLPAFSVSLLCGASSAHGQTPRPERPYRGLFGGGVDGSNQLLTANTSLGGGYDDNVLATRAEGESATQACKKLARSDTFREGSTILSTATASTRVRRRESSVRYYPSITDRLIQARTGTAGISVRVLDKPALTLNQSVAYQPFSIATIFPVAVEPNIGAGAPPDLDVVLTQDHYLSYVGGLGLSQRLTRRSTLSADYSYDIRNASRR